MKKLIMTMVLGAALASGAFGGSGELPAGYVKVEYIESRTWAYIDTGYHPTLTTRIVADFNPLKIESWESFFGVTGNDESIDGILMRYYDEEDKINGWFCNENYPEAQVAGVANKRIQVELKAGGMTVNGTNATITTTGTPYDGSIYIFAVNHKGERYRPHVMRLYSFTIFDVVEGGEKPMRNFVPCFCVNDQKIGLYDLAEGDPGKAFYSDDGNSGFNVPPGDVCTITVGDLSGMTAQYTFGDGLVTNGISGSAFAILKGTTGLKVIFKPMDRYEIDKTEYAFDGVISGNCEIPAEDLPTATYRYVKVSMNQGKRVIASWTGGDGSKTNAINGTSFEVLRGTENVVVQFEPASDYVVDGEAKVNLGTVTADITFGVGNDYAAPRAYCKRGDVAYLDWNGLQMTNAVLSKYDYLLVKSDTSELTSGWYVFAEKEKISRGSITVKGTVHLVLVDGCELEANGGDKEAGVAVQPGNSLTIYGQTANTGKLAAAGGDNGSGVGAVGAIVGGTPTMWGIAGGYGCNGTAGTVTINGGTVAATGGQNTTMGGGSAGACIGGVEGGEVIINGGRVVAFTHNTPSILGKGPVRISSGLFSFRPEDQWLADQVSMGVFKNDDATTAEEFPWAVRSVERVVVFGQPLVGMTAVWTSGDGAKTNAVGGTFFKVAIGAKNAKVVFTPESGYKFADANETGVRGLPSPLDQDVTVAPPPVERFYIPSVGPWGVGEGVTAFVSEEGTLVITGTGAMKDFASAADMPWDPEAIKAVTIADGVTQIGANAWSGMEDSVVINGTTLSAVRYLALGIGSAEPSGAISGAEIEKVDIVDGKALLDVSVYTNSEVKAKGEGEGWGVATNGVIVVPAPGKQGFFYLMSKPKGK